MSPDNFLDLCDWVKECPDCAANEIYSLKLKLDNFKIIPKDEEDLRRHLDEISHAGSDPLVSLSDLVIRLQQEKNDIIFEATDWAQTLSLYKNVIISAIRYYLDSSQNDIEYSNQYLNTLEPQALVDLFLELFEKSKI